MNEKTPQPQFQIISPLLYTCTMVIKFGLDFLLYLSTLLELPDGGCKRRLISELGGCFSVEWTKSDEFRQLDLLHIWGEPPSETSAGAWLECITDEIWNKANVFFYEELYDADGLYDPWHAFFLRCPDGGCKCGNYSRWVSIKTDTRTQALATCSGGPRCLEEWRRRLSKIKGHSTLDAIFTKFWRTERGSWQTSSLEAQNYKNSLFKQFKSNFCCETSSC